MTHDCTVRIDRETFLRAPPDLPERVRGVIDEIRKNRCFIDRGLVFDPKYSARSHDRSRHAPRGGFPAAKGRRPNHRDAGPVRRPTVIGGDVSRDRRCITENINKITRANYGTVSRRMIIVLDDDNLRYGVSEILDKAYEQFDRCSLYVDLILDICKSLGPQQKEVLQAFLRAKLDESLEEDPVYPHVDPKGDYDGFCRVVKTKTRAVGRCGAFSKMLQKVQGFFGHTPEEYYDHHERLVFRYVNEDAGAGAGADVDVAASVETLLDCLQVIVKHYNAMKSKFRMAVSRVPAADFPSNKCRFKVLDILGK